MEKTLTRLKSNLKSRRKLSLPMLVGQFHQHWNGTDNSQQQLPSNGPRGAESEEVLYEDTTTVHPSMAGSTPDDVAECSDDDESTLDELANRSAMGKAWLSFSRSRRAKARNKPRRWPSTPAFLPTSSRSSLASSPSSTTMAGDGQPSVPHPLPPLPPSSSLTASGGQHGGSSHNLTAKASTGRPQPYIQGYHLTLPSFLSNRSRHLPQTATNQSERNRQMYQVVHMRNKFF